MPKVTMSLTERDVANTEKLREALGSRSNAHTVSIALSLTCFIVDQLREGSEILLQDLNGKSQKVVMAELAPVMRQSTLEA